MLTSTLALGHDDEEDIVAAPLSLQLAQVPVGVAVAATNWVVL